MFEDRNVKQAQFLILSSGYSLALLKELPMFLVFSLPANSTSPGI